MNNKKYNSEADLVQNLRISDFDLEVKRLLKRGKGNAQSEF